MKRLGNTENVISWKSKDSSAKIRTTFVTTDNSLSPSIKRYGNLNFCLVFKGNYLKQKNATYTSPSRIIFFHFYELDAWLRDLNSDFTSKDCLFGRVKLANIANP